MDNYSEYDSYDSDDSYDSEDLRMLTLEDFYMVSSFEKLREFCGLEEIILTGNFEGYLKFKNAAYLKFNDKKNIGCKNIETIFSEKQFFVYINGLNVSLEYKNNYSKIYLFFNWENIKKEIMKNITPIEVTEYIMQYDEFLVWDKNKRPKIFKTSDFTFKDINNSRIVCGVCNIIIDMDVDISLIKKLMRKLIPEKCNRDIFRKLCRSIFIHPNHQEVIVFYDSFYKVTYLWDWLTAAMKNLNCNPDVFFDKKPYQKLNELNEELGETVPKLVIFSIYYTSYIENILDTKWKKMKTKNFLVVNELDRNSFEKEIYDEKSLIKYFNENESKILENFPIVKEIMDDLKNPLTFLYTFTQSLQNDRYFFNQMLKWSLVSEI